MVARHYFGARLRRAVRLCLLHLLVLLPIAAGLILSPGDARALPKDDGGEGEPTNCPASTLVSARLVIDGIHLENRIVRGRAIAISAADAKIVHVSANCNSELYPLPAGELRWSLATRPTGSAATLGGTSTLTASLTPDTIGSYLVRFTGCPGGCRIGNLDVEEKSFDLALEAVNSLALPPGTDPVVTAQRATQPSEIPDANEKCLGGGGVVDPQWVTVEQWNGALDYRRVEGEVEKARISRKDNLLNHDSQDFLVYVKPDPAFRSLLRGTQQNLEVEWERSHFPEPFRPTAGDRVTMFGYWVLDCGHDAKTEIHPPVGIATQRARPIMIPSNIEFDFPSDDDVRPVIRDTVGTGVYVPGIVTDLWFNRDSGEITRNCSTTGLHQPGRFVSTPNGIVSVQGACIRGPSPIDTVYRFNIYLPPKPELRFRAAVPLYVEVTDHPFGFGVGPDPQITLIEREGAVPYLQVDLNLTGFTGSRYARRIEAGWVLASPDNWGLRRWKLRLNNIDVHDDGDSRLRGDGDWRFWIDTNNSMPEWTKLFDCDGCVHGNETFGGRPYQTGASADVSPDRTLGPDILLFPHQRIWVHTSGFESDSFVDDDTGSVNDLRPQQSATYASRRFCTDQTISGCADYTLHYEIRPGPAVAAANLSSGAANLLEDYSVSSATDADCLICGVVTEAWYPYDAMLTPGDSPIVISETLLFRQQPNPEIFALTDISLDNFRALLVRTRETRPSQIDILMPELRAEVDELLASGRNTEVRYDVLLMRDGIPPDLWDQYFGDLLLHQVHVPLVKR